MPALPMQLFLLMACLQCSCIAPAGRIGTGVGEETALLGVGSIAAAEGLDGSPG